MAEDKDELRPIHTYQADALDAIKQEGITRSQILIAEQNRIVEETVPPKAPGFTFNMRFMGLALLFLIVGGIGLYYYTKASTKIVPVASVATTPEQKLISYDAYEKAVLTNHTRDSILGVIKNEKAGTSSQGLKVLSFGADFHADEFLSLLVPELSGSFTRSLDPEFAYGVSVRDTTSVPRSFLVVKVNSFQTARGSLFSDEISMAKGMSQMFGVSYSPNMDFRDRVVANHDIRTLTDIGNVTYFLYSFIDANTLVFAEDDDTFKTIIDRINSSKR